MTSMVNSKGVIFREVQRFNQLWVWLFILLATAGTWYAAIVQILLKKPVGENPAPDLVIVILWFVLGLAFPLLFYYAKLITEVRYDGLYFCYFPFHLSFRKISWAEIKKYEACTYRPLREYGGYGIRHSRHGKAYNVSGNKGVKLELFNGKKILIGSQRPAELVKAIDTALGK